MDVAKQSGRWRFWSWHQKLGALAALALSLFLLAFGGLFLVVHWIITDSDPHRMALGGATHHPDVIALIGAPVNRGWPVTGGIETDSASGNANLSIPLVGPDGRATLRIEAEQRLGAWRITKAELTQGKTERIALAPDDFNPPASPRPLR